MHLLSGGYDASVAVALGLSFVIGQDSALLDGTGWRVSAVRTSGSGTINVWVYCAEHVTWPS
jgi:hypothetical protein